MVEDQRATHSAGSSSIDSPEEALPAFDEANCEFKPSGFHEQSGTAVPRCDSRWRTTELHILQVDLRKRHDLLLTRPAASSGRAGSKFVCSARNADLNICQFKVSDLGRDEIVEARLQVRHDNLNRIGQSFHVFMKQLRAQVHGLVG